MTEPVTLCVELNSEEFLDSRIVRLQKGWRLRFVCGKGLLGKAVKLEIVNTSISYTFKALRSLRDLDSENVFDYKCSEFGAFSYNVYALKGEASIGRGYFSVVPEWKVADSLRVLSLNGLSIVTHQTKLLGPLSEWRDRLAVAKEAGYNVIHLTPIQTLGISNSSYSVADHHRLNSSMNANFDDLETFVRQMEHDWQVLTIQDVVWNHAAKNADWLWQHPECAFNCANSPHLRPAFVIDRALLHFSREIAAGKWKCRGLPARIDNDAHLGALKDILETDVFPSLNLHEFFQIDVERAVAEFRTGISGHNVGQLSMPTTAMDRLLIADEEFHRFGTTIHLANCLDAFHRVEPSALSDDERVVQCCDSFRQFLEAKNAEVHAIAAGHSAAAIQATLGHVAYERVAGHGLRRHLVTEDAPLVTNYFLFPPDIESTSWRADERLAYDNTIARYLMACNGWVMNADPLVNFAEPPSLVYYRRELVCWGDCVKLNYGRKPSDCPYLWEYMREYTERCAKIFHGFRIDNCHSTPIHVAEYLLKAARKIRHNLYVVAELFTGSETMDHLFVNRLGITSLVRECQNAPDSHEQGRFVYRYSGDAVGAFRSKSVRPAPAGVAHALFYDQTHDNPPPAMKRTLYDYVPTAAMTAMTYCASGTTRGYDELISYHIDVVSEKRLYGGWSEIKNDPHKIGMIRARRLFNDLHARLAETGFSEIFVDQVNADIVAITRHNPATHESVLLISHCCFSEFKWTPNCKDIPVADDITDILFEVKMVEDHSVPTSRTSEFSERLTGLPNYRVEIYENVSLDKSMAVDVLADSTIRFKGFTSGSVIAFRIKPKTATVTACTIIEDIVSEPTKQNEFADKLRQLDLQEFNYLLFRCEAEESAQDGADAYDVPNYGKLVYCGLQGIHSVLKRIQETNDLGHLLCSNLRDGTWLCDYIVDRLTRTGNEKFIGIAVILRDAFGHLSNGVTHFLRPCYFEMIFSYFYTAVQQVANEKLFGDCTKIPQLAITEKLSLSALSFVASIANAKLPPIIGAKCAAAGGDSDKTTVSPSLSAGLPHFAEGIWRNWGRDTFIALPGVLLLNGRFAEAHDIIVAFAGTLRHGLIPNLLAEGRAARYNCRDAVWFWLVAILKYVELAPNGVAILQSKVLRLYATDDAEYLSTEKVEPLHATMYEAICRHFDGISFRERNAGHRIDEHMTHEGFNIEARIDHESGLVFGGNVWNCGTWMDKMGSSERAGNRGQPATPRDGAAVELQGLALRVAEGLERLSTEKHFPYHEIRGQSGEKWTWKEWAARLRSCFPQKFYVGDDCQDQFVHRKNIVKDSFGSSGGFTDFQLRPNFCIALDAVPDIVEPEQAWKALEIAREVLVGPLGIKTLDPKDWAYNGYYNNDDDGHHKQTAKGWNYHQGPEWLWVASLYLSAKLKVANLLAKKTGDQSIWQAAVDEAMEKISAYSIHIRTDPWTSLPELTNKDGTTCHHSCPAQAWSIGCFTEALHSLDTILKQNH